MNITMCPPKYFGVDYEINPWMHTSCQPDLDLAKIQWKGIRDTFSKIKIQLDFIEPKNGYPDMVFVANAGLPVGSDFILSNFHYKERQGESLFFYEYFSKRFNIITLPDSIKFEGQGDAFFACGKLLAGYGFRSSPNFSDWMKEKYKCDVLRLHLINDKFYHLDTAIAQIEEGVFVVVKEAFSDESIKSLKKEDWELIFLSKEDAENFVANLIVYKKNIVLNKISNPLRDELEKRGFNIFETPTSEFMKSGGSVRCLSLVY